MTGTPLSSDGLDLRRRKLLFHAWHRGMRETDLILGRFPDFAIAQMSDAELTQFQRLMEGPDPELLAWVTGEAADGEWRAGVPGEGAVRPAHETPLFCGRRVFNRSGGGGR